MGLLPTLQRKRCPLQTSLMDCSVLLRKSTVNTSFTFRVCEMKSTWMRVSQNCLPSFRCLRGRECREAVSSEGGFSARFWNWETKSNGVSENVACWCRSHYVRHDQLGGGVHFTSGGSSPTRCACKPFNTLLRVDYSVNTVVIIWQYK